MLKKEAQEAVDGAYDKVKNFSDGGSRLGEFWNSLSPTTKNLLVNTLFGSALGAAVTGVSGGTAADTEGGESALMEGLKSAVPGAILGGLTTGGTTLAYNLLNKDVELPGEQTRKGIENAPGDIIGFGMRHPFASLGAILGVAPTANAASGIEHALEQASAAGAKNISKWTAMRRALIRGGKGPGVLGTLLRLAAIPAGITAGAILDKRLHGD